LALIGALLVAPRPATAAEIHVDFTGHGKAFHPNNASVFCTDDCTFAFTQVGSGQKTVRAESFNGWTFNRWEGCVSTSGMNCTLEVDEGPAEEHFVAVFFDDTAPPTASLSGPPTATIRGTVGFSVTNAGDNAAITRVEYSVTGAASNPVAVSTAGPTYPIDVDTTAYGDGAHTVTATAFDAAGNSTSSQFTYTFDNTLDWDFVSPTPADGAFVNAQSPQLKFTKPDDVPDGNVVCRTDRPGAPGQAGVCSAAGYTPQTPADDTYTVTVTQTDVAGNTRTRTRSFVVDRTAPSVGVSNPASGAYLKTAFTPQFTVNDAHPGSTECRLDGTVRPCGSAVAPGDGPHTFTVAATDLAANTTTADVPFTWDATAPTATIDSGPVEGSTIAGNSPELGFTTGDASPISRQCGVDGALGNCTTAGSHQLAALSNGPHTFTLRVTDAAGNVTTRSRSFTVDASPPVITITGGPADGSRTAQTAHTFTFTVTDAVEVRCSIDSASAFRACSGAGSDALAGLADGTHVFRVRARDSASSITVAARTFVVDTSQPQTRIDSGPADGSTTPGTSVSFAFGATDPRASFRCRLYAAGPAPAFAPCSGPGNTHSAGGLAPGTYVFEVVATNSLGTTDGSPAKRTFTLAALPTGPGGAGGPFVVDVGLSYKWAVGKRLTKILRLRLLRLKPGMTVRVGCAGRGCPFKFRKPAVKRKPTLNLARLFKGRKLKPGAVIEIRVASPGFTGKVFRYVIRKGRKGPKGVVLCLPEGAKKPSKC
jgi:hypothetical protein